MLNFLNRAGNGREEEGGCWHWVLESVEALQRASVGEALCSTVLLLLATVADDGDEDGGGDEDGDEDSDAGDGHGGSSGDDRK